MTDECNDPKVGLGIKIPDEIWSSIASSGKIFLWINVSIRLLDGSIFEEMIATNRGYIIGRRMEGLAGAHGGIDSSMLVFSTSDIEGVLMSKRHFWQKRVWYVLNPNHPARFNYSGKKFSPPPIPKRVLPDLKTMIVFVVFWAVVFVFTILAVVGLFHVCGWLR